MRQWVWLLFFLSGASGLMYEVVWVRMMTHVFGTTAVAVGTVIGAFMSGLAMGSWLLGKVADRYPNPLRLYAYLEIGVGLAALGAHFLLTRITTIYTAVYEVFGRSDAALGVTRFFVAFGIVMVPTLLMGGTLPVLARFVVTRFSRLGVGLSALYAINTIGAVAGTLITGFYLIGAHGIHLTVLVAVLVNLGIGVIAWLGSARGAITAPLPELAPQRVSPATERVGAVLGLRTYRLLLFGLAISGFTSFAYEIYWMRSLVFLLGSSTYAVTTMLAAFLTGIALGGYLVRFLLDRNADHVGLFGWLQVLIAVSASLLLPALFVAADPAAIREFLIEAADNASGITVMRFAVAFLFMIVPATLIGMTFPLVGRICVLDLNRAGSTIGRVYALNTLGNVAGALLPGLVLLHWFGVQRGILAMALLNAGIGFLILLSRPVRPPVLRWVAPTVVIGVALLVIRTTFGFQFPSRSQAPGDRVLFYSEGPSVTTKVFINPDTRVRSMSVDGISIGGSGAIDYKQKLLAHLPKLFVDDVSSELSVGLGSAILVGESARYDRVRKITCVEIGPSVVAGAAYFPDESHGVLQDSRLEIVVDDVLSHLRNTPVDYQVISADEKTLMDYASNGFSYSREYYALLRDHMAPGGLVIQWVPTGLPPRLYKMVLKTFASAFPHVLLWYSPPAVRHGPTNTILLGSNEAISLDIDSVRRRIESSPAALAGIAEYGLTTASAMLAHLVADESTIRPAVDSSAENTLDHPRYEFFSLREYAVPLSQRLIMNHDFLMGLRQSAAPALWDAMASDADDVARLKNAFAAENDCLGAYRQFLAGAPEPEVRRQFEAALARAPWNKSVASRVFLHYRLAAAEYHNRGNPIAAVSFMQRAIEVYGENAHARTEYAIILLTAGQAQRAAEELQVAVEVDPGLVLARRALADIQLKAGRRHEAAKQLRALLEIEPLDDAARELLSRLH